MTEPTWFVEWSDNDPDPETVNRHEIEAATLADVLGIMSAALDGNAWDVSIMQHDTEQVAA